MLGDFFQGQFKENFYDGLGTHINKAAGWKYEGNFYNGFPQGSYSSFVCLTGKGEGKMNFSNGSSYIGSFSDGKYDGHGEYQNSEGLHYLGSFKNHMPDGTTFTL